MSKKKADQRSVADLFSVQPKGSENFDSDKGETNLNLASTSTPSGSKDVTFAIGVDEKGLFIFM